MKLICLENNKSKIYKLLSIIVLIVWMIMVFILSNETSHDSTNRSNKLIENIVRIFDKSITEQNINKIIDIVTPGIRKTTHFLLYTLGGFIIFNVFNIYMINIKHSKRYSVLFGVIYAISDELHQLNVLGRSGEVRDVIIDSLGILLGVFICDLLFKIIKEDKWKKI